jgi:pseudouridine synthase
LASRRAAEELIRAGRVTVDGKPAHLGQKVDVSRVHIEVDRIPLPVRPDLVWYLVFKPTGVVSTVTDPHGRPAVVDLVPAETRVYPVGRLDADSEGLLILTNDGDLTELLTHPRHRVPKTYVARVAGRPTAGDVRSLTEGVELDDGPAQAQSARLLDAHGSEAMVEIVMTEGRKREVRRMFDAIGLPVLRLVRTAIGPLRDRTLRSGEWRRLTVEEIRTLYAAAGKMRE